jgi:hypothetical protein
MHERQLLSRRIARLAALGCKTGSFEVPQQREQSRG